MKSFDETLETAWFELCDAVESVFFDDLCRITFDGRIIVVSEIVFLKNFLTPNRENILKVCEAGFEIDVSRAVPFELPTEEELEVLRLIDKDKIFIG